MVQPHDKLCSLLQGEFIIIRKNVYNTVLGRERIKNYKIISAMFTKKLRKTHWKINHQNFDYG